MSKRNDNPSDADADMTTAERRRYRRRGGSLRVPSDDVPRSATPSRPPRPTDGKPANARTNDAEPMLMVINHGKGRVVHNALGHADYSMACKGFQETLERGVEWAATGKVERTAALAADFPTADKASPSAAK